MGLQALEQDKGGRPLIVRHEGAVFSLPVPAQLSLDAIMAIIQRGGIIGLLPRGTRLPLWRARVLLERWMAHHGLGTPQEVGRLTALLERFEPQVASDLRAFAGVDLRDLWQARRWRYLLQLIDHLPPWSHYASKVVNDPEIAQQIAEAQARVNAEKGGTEAYSPPMTKWTPEVEAITRLIDVTKGVQHAIIVSNSDPKKGLPKAPEPEPRPKTALQTASKKAEARRRQEAHEALVARMLPHKRH